MDSLRNTNWILVEEQDDSGWTLFPEAVDSPGNLLSFNETLLVNWDFRFGSEGFSYVLKKNEIEFNGEKWNIDQLTSEELIITYLHKKYIYKRIEPAPRKWKLSGIENILTNRIWKLRSQGEYASTLCIFLKEKLENSEDFLPGYSVLIKVGYHKEIMKYPSSASEMSGWKLNIREQFCFLSLYDSEKGNQHFELVSCTEHQMLFQGKFDLYLEK